MNRNHALVYGFTPDEIAQLNVHLTKKNYLIKECNEENINHPDYSLILIKNTINPKIELYLKEIEGNLVKIRLIGLNWKIVSKNFKEYLSFDDYLRVIDYDLDKIEESKKSIQQKVNNFEKIIRIYSILKKHKSLSLITLEKLSGYKKLEIRRYIEVLQWMNEPIKYDFYLNVWKYE